ncbi:uncharacterized protein PAC_19357 [Phialocephala subalpina]|uniref:Glutathione S-transferase UstS-like C-terminal domain-containing protein n=1 Tax=Phialocephala subalpina TaxID=576137 RepID=A0A1L7XWS2_9HELO|nr:uncharacterized protein PAC_19357 [Phialocephala subalpina]
MSQLILYDLPSKDPRQCWSYNPWKTRLVLNYKKLDYKTVWTEYPDIEPTLKDQSAPLLSSPPYTHTRTLQRPTKPTGTNSLHNAGHITHGRVARLVLNYKKLDYKTVWTEYPDIEPTLKDQSAPLLSSPPYTHTRTLQRPTKPTGTNSLHNLLQLKNEIGGEEAWMEALPGIKALGELLGKNGGPFVEGDTPSYADFVTVGWLQFLKVIEEDYYQRLVKVDPAIGKLYDASKPWLERNDH